MRSIAAALTITLAAGCYNSEHHSPTDPIFVGALRLTAAASSIQADGNSRVTLTAHLDPATATSNRAVNFKTTAGTFVGATPPGKDAVANADTTGLATVDLRSSTDVENAVVTATVSGITASVTIAFTPLNADDVIRISSTANTMPADGFSRITITAQLGSTASTTSRAVAFKTTAGTFVGAASPGKDASVNADSAGVAKVELRSSTDIEQATVTATAGGVTRTLTIAFLAVNPADIIRVSTSSNVVPADGETILQVVAQVAAGLQSNQREVSFTTSIGSFVKSGNQTATETAGLDQRAVVDLKASPTIGTARVTATVNGVRAETTMAFVAALPQRVEVVVPVSIKANEEVTVTAKLFRTPGNVSRDRVVTFTAVDPDGKTIGVFHNVQVSAGDGTAAALFTPNSTEYRGPITIRAFTPSDGGGTVTGQASTTIVNPST